MKRILTAILLIAAVVALLLYGQPRLINLAAAIVALLAALEYRHLANAHIEDPHSGIPLWWMLLGSASVCYLAFCLPYEAVAAISALGMLLFIRCGFRSPLDRVLPVTAAGIFGLIYVVWPLTLLARICNEEENGVALLFLLMVCVWAGDIAALYAGRAIGGPKLAPRVSPGKTWAGSIASLVAALLCSAGLVALGNFLVTRGNSQLYLPARWWAVLLLAALLNISAQVGDLLESAIKRGANVKDSGSMLPGHGGILDRIDALLLAAPVLWFTLKVLDAVGKRF